MGTERPNRGEETHLVVMLAYCGQGETSVGAWVGMDDQTLSFVGKGEYASSHDEYRVHAIAPDPLPANVMWWIEIEKPDGQEAIGSVTPLVEYCPPVAIAAPGLCLWKDFGHELDSRKRCRISDYFDRNPYDRRLPGQSM